MTFPKVVAIVASLLALGLAAMGSASALAAEGDGKAGAATARVYICHYEGNGSYHVVEVSDDGNFSGHDKHKRDLIPSPTGSVCPGNDPGSCKEKKLPCDNIPAVPNHLAMLLAVALGIGGFGGIRYWRGRER